MHIYPTLKSLKVGEIFLLLTNIRLHIVNQQLCVDIQHNTNQKCEQLKFNLLYQVLTSHASAILKQ